MGAWDPDCLPGEGPLALPQGKTLGGDHRPSAYAGLEQCVQKTLFPEHGFDTFHGQHREAPPPWGAWKVRCEIQWPNFRPWVSVSKQQQDN